MNLREAMLNHATVDGNIVKVDGFLNHRVHPDIIAIVGQIIADWFSDRQPDVLLTAEASGAPPTAIAAQVLGVPYIYARNTSVLANGIHSLEKSPCP